jgi:hypothetical protein
MEKSLSRRTFLENGGATVVVVSGGLMLPGLTRTASAQGQTAPPRLSPRRGPQLKMELVKEFVTVGHGNLDRVRELLEIEPKLINSCYDWGGGDWETALGGAAHWGNRAIAEYLLEKGARIDLFAAAMLGKLDMIKAAVAAFPGAVKVLGPHGIPLIAHAKAGGEPAAAVLEFLTSLAGS